MSVSQALAGVMPGEKKKEFGSRGAVRLRSPELVLHDSSFASIQCAGYNDTSLALCRTRNRTHRAAELVSSFAQLSRDGVADCRLELR